MSSLNGVTTTCAHMPRARAQAAQKSRRDECEKSVAFSRYSHRRRLLVAPCRRPGALASVLLVRSAQRSGCSSLAKFLRRRARASVDGPQSLREGDALRAHPRIARDIRPRERRAPRSGQARARASRMEASTASTSPISKGLRTQALTSVARSSGTPLATPLIRMIGIPG